MKYRLEAINDGFDKVKATQDLFETVANMANRWKKDKPYFEVYQLTSQEFQQIETATHYPHFVKLIANDKSLLDAFFLWSFRDKSSVEVFVEFPALQERLYISGISQRIGRFGGNSLKLAKKVIGSQGKPNVVAKMVFLPIEGQDMNILDETKVIQFRNNYKLKC